MAITAAMVKELRERTAAGMMDCKKALQEADGDMELAIENMRKNGQAKAAKKAGNIAAEGTILIKDVNGVAALLEVNCQTDFVAKDANFLAFANEVLDVAAESKVTIEDHGATIGVVVAGEGDAESLKHIAMHVAASKPEFLTPDDVPAEVVEKEKAIQIEIAMNEGKPQEIAEKMVSGRMRKFTGEVSLTGQAFIMEPKKTVGEVLKEKGITISSFTRLEVGEGIEKKDEDFAAEVEAQIAAAKA